MRYIDLTGSHEAAGRSIRMRYMARRLPQLVRRSLALAWRVDRRATIGLLLCQAVTGVMQALGLVAISGTLTALLTSGDVYLSTSGSFRRGLLWPCWPAPPAYAPFWGSPSPGCLPGWAH